MATSAEIVGSVTDLLIKIMLCLPVKSLMRFKSISKNWKSLITSPQFAQLWNRDPNPAVGLFYPTNKPVPIYDYIRLDGEISVNLPFREISFPNDPFRFWIQQSCNGLLLCCSAETCPTYGFGLPGINKPSFARSPIRSCYVYNPTTKCFTKLPKPGVLDGFPRIVYGVNLAFDQSKSPTYKVVCVRGSQFGPDLYEIEIYSPESGVWKASGKPFKANSRFDHGVYWNGSVHWICERPDELLYFNVEEEKFGNMPLPAAFESGGINYLGESCNHLLMILRERYVEVNFNVYEMNRDYSEWFVTYRVDLATVAAAFPGVSFTGPFRRKGCPTPSILSVIRGKEGPYLVLHLQNKVLRFNIESESYEEICEVDGFVGGLFFMGGSRLPRAFEHIVSLACA